MPLTPPFNLDRTARTPLYRQIEQQIRAAILDGRLPPTFRLPPIRQLASDLNVARVTVSVAYDQLVAEGYLVPRVGSGTRVVDDLPDPHLAARARRRSVPRPLAQSDEHRPPPPPSGAPFRRSLVGSFPPVGTLPIDFRPGKVGTDLFPHKLWGSLLRKAWQSAASSQGRVLLDYGHPAGLRLLREEVATYLGAARAVNATPDRVIITVGAQSSFYAVARLLGPGGICAVEDPGYLMARRAFEAWGHAIVGVPVDANGLLPEKLPDRGSAVVVTPSWHYPGGGTLPLSRRIQLLDWARQRGALVVEDDYDSELRYVGHPLSSLQGIDDSGRVLYVGTFSKAVFPALRLGYAVVPEGWEEPFAAMVELYSLGPGNIEQLALAAFLAERHLERHLRRLRLAYAARQEALLDAVATVMPGLAVTARQPAGTHLILRLVHEGITASDVARRAERRGVFVRPLSLHRIARAPDRDLVVGYAGSPPDVILAGVRVLADATLEAIRDADREARSRSRSPSATADSRKTKPSQAPAPAGGSGAASGSGSRRVDRNLS